MGQVKTFLMWMKEGIDQELSYTKDDTIIHETNQNINTWKARTTRSPFTERKQELMKWKKDNKKGRKIKRNKGTARN